MYLHLIYLHNKVYNGNHDYTNIFLCWCLNQLCRKRSFVQDLFVIYSGNHIIKNGIKLSSIDLALMCRYIQDIRETHDEFSVKHMCRADVCKAPMSRNETNGYSSPNHHGQITRNDVDIK